MSKFTERSEVHFIVFRRKTIRHMQSMCSLPQELACKLRPKAGFTASIFVCLFVCVLLNQLNMAAHIDLIFSMHSPIDLHCAIGYKKFGFDNYFFTNDQKSCLI